MSAGGVRVVTASLDVKEPRLRELRAWLSAAERARAERFVLELHRRRFVAARGMLREALAAELLVEPAAVGFEHGPRGKPRLVRGVDPELGFNVSHAQDRAVFAIARGLELGVDIEALREDVEHAAIARRFFSPGERDALFALPDRARAAAFFTIWTRKEAYIKLLGGGLVIPLDSFEVNLEEPARLLRAGSEGAAERVELRSLEAPPGFVAALAVAARGAISQL